MSRMDSGFRRNDGGQGAMNRAPTGGGGSQGEWIPACAGMTREGPEQ